MRKIYFLLLSFCISFNAFSQSYSGGDGTEGTPFLISNAADLVYLSTDDTNWDKYFKLTTDVDMADQDFYPIGYHSNTQWKDYPFTGTFDGDYNIISNVTVLTRANNTAWQMGFFGQVIGGSVKNLGLVNITVDGPNYHRVGGLMGTSKTATTISNCFVDGGFIQGNSDGVGGLVGWFEYGGTIDNCYTNVTIKVNEVAGVKTNAAGIIGKVQGAEAIRKLSNVAVYGTTETGNNAVVGVGTITHENAYFKSESGAAGSDGAMLLADAAVQSNYAFDFTNIWEMSSERGYAILQGFSSLPTDINSTKSVEVGKVFTSGKTLFIQDVPRVSSYEVYNLSGSLVSKGTFNGSLTKTLSVSKGLYIVKVGSTTTKVMIQ